MLMMAEYLDKNGDTCPVCKIANVKYISEPKAVCDTITREVACMEMGCGAQWTEIYKLQPYRNLQRK